ncbi:fatty acyl-CoA reductase 2-like [Chenopodium quinoa]|nr:fatty acyl-CoA reductase 2-like [Chenopodium quinoa]
MKDKLVAVVGNITGHPCLGMDADLAGVIASQIDVIVNVAADTRWHARYDVLLDVNVRGVSRLLAFAMNCKKLLLLLHVSTAFVTRKAVGVVHENPIVMEKSKLRTVNSNSDVPAELDIKAELKIVDDLLASGIQECKLPREMIKLGMRRTKLHGYANAYILTKVMGEMIVSTMGDKLPTVIIRPSFIGNSLQEPFAGWIEKYRGMDPIILSYGEGQMQGILADPNGIIDIVPVDILANAIVVAIANHAISGKLGVHVYHLASSMVKPLQLQTLFKYCCNYFALHPFKDSKGDKIKVEEMDFYASLDEYILAGMNSKPSNEKLYSHIVRIAAIYEPILMLRLRFNNMNTQNLFEAMFSEEKKIFNFDVNRIDWKDYFMNIQLRGLTKHILKKKNLSPKL